MKKQDTKVNVELTELTQEDVNTLVDSEVKSFDIEPTSVVKYNKDTKTLVFSTNFTITNEKNLLEVFSELNNLELIIANLSVATKQYLEFITDNVQNGDLASIVKVLSK